LIEELRIKKLVEHNERSRIEKRLLEIQKQKGSNSLKLIRNIDNLIKDPEFKPLKFSIEDYGFKDSIENRQKKAEKKEKSKEKHAVSFYKGKSIIVIFIGDMSSRLNTLETERNKVLALDFKVTDTHSERIELFNDSDPTKIIEDFAHKWSKYIFINII